MTVLRGTRSGMPSAWDEDPRGDLIRERLR